MRPGETVWSPECGAVEVWFVRPSGAVTCRVAGEYRDLEVVPILPRRETATLKRGDVVVDVYGETGVVRYVDETGPNPPALVLQLGDTQQVRIWTEIQRRG